MFENPALLNMEAREVSATPVPRVTSAHALAVLQNQGRVVEAVVQAAPVQAAAPTCRAADVQAAVVAAAAPAAAPAMRRVMKEYSDIVAGTMSSQHIQARMCPRHAYNF